MKQGGWCGVAPIGYLNKLDDNTIIIDPERASLIRKVWEAMLEGNSTEETRRMLNEDLGFRTVKRKHSGGRPLSYSGIYRMLRNPFYYGFIKRKHNGEMMEFTGTHEPIITEKEFWHVQEILGEPVPRPHTKAFAYTGMIRCAECGCHFTAYEVLKKSGKLYAYYRCSQKNDAIDCQQPQISKKDLETQIVTLLTEMTIPTQFANWATRWLRYLHENETGTHVVARESLQNAYNDVQNRIEKLTDVLIRELITEDEYKKRKDALLSERSKLKEKIDDKEQETDNWIVRMEKAFAFAKEAKSRFESSEDVKARKTLVRSLGSNFTLSNKKLALNMEPVWKLFSDHSRQLFQDLTLLDIDEAGMFKEKTAASATVLTRWQGRRDSNPDDRFWRPACYH